MTKVKISLPLNPGEPGDSVQSQTEALRSVSDSETIEKLNNVFPAVNYRPPLGEASPTRFAYASGQACVVDMLVNIYNTANPDDAIERKAVYMDG